ncbi:unnamed protein product [marine sediment metagenome]|uniref:Semialdehyde dehydrogenase dimerisation domain-containing protein n=1 Tax=marine sediment metagenome TaxID=412755 RepID=X1D798_9ZZZZ
MLNRETDLLKEAEKLENQSKVAEGDKNYDLAISVLMQAKDNYTKLGLTGQVSIIIKEIVRLQHLRRDNDKGMAVTIGRLRKDTILDYKFVALSHNTVRGAAGGAILNAELLKAKGFIK